MIYFVNFLVTCRFLPSSEDRVGTCLLILERDVDCLTEGRIAGDTTKLSPKNKFQIFAGSGDKQMYFQTFLFPQIKSKFVKIDWYSYFNFLGSSVVAYFVLKIQDLMKSRIIMSSRDPQMRIIIVAPAPREMKIV